MTEIANRDDTIDSRGNKHLFAFEAREANLRYRLEEALRELGLYTEPAPRHLASLDESSRVARNDTYGVTAWRVFLRQFPAILRVFRQKSPILDRLAADEPNYFSRLDV